MPVARSYRSPRFARIATCAAAAAVLAPTAAAAQVAAPADTAPVPVSAPAVPAIRTGALELTFGGVAQTQFSTTSVADAAEPERWELRLVRPDVRFRLNDYFGGRIEPEFGGGRVVLRNAYVTFRPLAGLELRAGQQRKPFTYVAGPAHRLFAERGARIRGLDVPLYEHDNLVNGLGYVNFDTGLELIGSPRSAPWGPVFRLGIFNGPEMGVVPGRSTYQIAGRVTAEPLPQLRVGLGASRRDFASPGDVEPRTLRHGMAWAADVEYGHFAPGLHLVAEFAGGAADPFSEAGTRFRAMNLWGGYRTAPLDAAGEIRLEPVMRVSTGSIGADAAARAAAATGGTLLTPGVNLYFGALNRIMLDYDLWSPRGGGTSARSLKLTFQAAF
jgi:hypothetical protein